ncbi:MAG: type VI secretion protein IcmF/TssM N-terminal domain-containing protein [Gemmataceae bacterium]
MATFRVIRDGLKALAALLLPFLDPPGRGRTPVLRWGLHVLSLALVLAGLWYINWHFDLGKAVRSPFPQLHGIWLPLLFLLAYAALGVAAWLWRMLGPERPSVEYPDIDAAWTEALRALRQANLDATEPPLFLVLGRPLSREENLFAAAPIPWLAQGAPCRADAPLRVYAGRKAVFVTCAELSELGRQTRLLAGDSTAPQSARLGIVEALNERQSRLRYLCRLILRARRPYCPLNGILALVPLPGLADDAAAKRLADAAQTDVQTARDVFQLECPTVVLVTDLDRASGCAEFLGDCPPAARDEALGQRFPLVPDIDPHEVAGMIESGLASLCGSRRLELLEPKFLLDPAGGEAAGAPGAAVRKNMRLYQFAESVRQLGPRLARLARRVAAGADGGPPMLAGVFLAATGDDAARQAFVPGVIRLLLQDQNYVTWTPEALAEERSFAWMTAAGYVACVLLLALGGLGYWFWH